MGTIKILTKRLVSLGMLVALFAMMACSNFFTDDSALSTSDDSDTQTKGYQNSDRIVSASWLNTHLNDANLKIVDVRGHTDGAPAKYNEGHIPGAISIPANTTFQYTNADGIKGMLPSAQHIENILSESGIKPSDTIVFYDDIKSLWASRALWGMDVYGHENSKLLDGDIKVWIAKGYTVSQETPSVSKTTYTFSGTPKPDLLIGLDLVTKSINGKAEVLDTRSPDEYSGKNLRGNARGGHIPGAIHVNWTNNNAEDRTFLTGTELKDLYTKAGIVSGDEVYTLCQTAVRATHSWFVLNILLGYSDIGVYDGSAIEWANRDDTLLDVRS